MKLQFILFLSSSFSSTMIDLPYHRLQTLRSAESNLPSTQMSQALLIRKAFVTWSIWVRSFLRCQQLILKVDSLHFFPVLKKQNRTQKAGFAICSTMTSPVVSTGRATIPAIVSSLTKTLIYSKVLIIE